MASHERKPPNEGHELTVALVIGLRQGSADAGALLDRLYRDALVRFCWGYLGRIEEAEDAVQDVSYKVLTAERIPDAFRPWIYKLARNHCLNLRRNRARRKDDARLPAASQVHERLTGHLTRLVQGEERSRLVELVQELPEAQREVLRLRYVEELSRGEIALVLEVPESAVKSRLFEALKRLRERAAQLDHG
jgi:RNA polymerase sigma-70 factor (ECF subfamily)